MNTRRRLGLAAAVTAAALGVAAPALAAPGGTKTVGDSAEAWYRSTPTCALPTGCADVTGAPSPYAAGTLHVGVLTGMQESRTYLALDLTTLPPSTKPTGGTLLLPVATGSMDGTAAPETATLQACAVSDALGASDGSFAAPPATDCKAASAPATFVPASGSDPAAFTVPLAALARAWDTGSIPGAVAVLPADGTAATATWHVAFSARTRTGEMARPIQSAVSYTSVAVNDSASTPPEVPAPPFVDAPADPGPAGFDSGTGFAAQPVPEAPPVTQPAAGPAADAAPAAVPPQTAAVPVTERPLQAVPAAQVFSAAFRYPVVFLLPLLLALGVAWTGRALTRDLTAIGPSAGARG